MTSLPPIDFLHRLADAADLETMRRFRTPLKVDSKPKEGFRFDPVTEADQETERVIRSMIENEYPDHAIVGEEMGISGSGNLRWVIDPIDGTRPYLLGIPVWGTLIGLLKDEIAAIGMMSQPVTRERFWADASGSWMRRDNSVSPLQTRQVKRLSDAVLHCNSPEPIRRHADIAFKELTEQVKMTRYGGECYAFAMLAAGYIDICFEFSLQPHDIVAIVPIVEKAGGVISTLDGKRPENGGRILMAANQELHQAALSVLNSHSGRQSIQSFPE
ncbi:inositol monophosphatase family protein [Brucella sp. NBRC 12950]|uniref:inositol monophosphatase family protein n=1 Tax=Brucella sp. NBRC 12950 TaxID=2994518 RepID=UPI0024A0F8D4|nr:inositol monophosphatase family protein [Brucella sp. NBRC 12950]GLU30006.1 histidinol-phosphatase [Brucella sp. NBRC 12950]